MNNSELDKVVHQWCDDNDRWMYIEYNRDGKVMGLNFMQGDEYEIFKQVYCENNEHLFEFYEEMLDTFTIDKASINTVQFINKCMWAFFKCSSLYDKYKN